MPTENVFPIVRSRLKDLSLAITGNLITLVENAVSFAGLLQLIHNLERKDTTLSPTEWGGAVSGSAVLFLFQTYVFYKYLKPKTRDNLLIDMHEFAQPTTQQKFAAYLNMIIGGTSQALLDFIGLYSFVGTRWEFPENNELRAVYGFVLLSLLTVGVLHGFVEGYGSRANAMRKEGFLPVVALKTNGIPLSLKIATSVAPFFVTFMSYFGGMVNSTSNFIRFFERSHSLSNIGIYTIAGSVGCVTSPFLLSDFLVIETKKIWTVWGAGYGSHIILDNCSIASMLKKMHDFYFHMYNKMGVENTANNYVFMLWCGKMMTRIIVLSGFCINLMALFSPHKKEIHVADFPLSILLPIFVGVTALAAASAHAQFCAFTTATAQLLEKTQSDFLLSPIPAARDPNTSASRDEKVTSLLISPNARDPHVASVDGFFARFKKSLRETIVVGAKNAEGGAPQPSRLTL